MAQENLTCPQCGETLTNMGLPMRFRSENEAAGKKNLEIFTCMNCGWVGTQREVPIVQ